MDPKTVRPDTIAAQALGWVDERTRAIIPPIHVSSTYLRDPDNQYRSGRVYARADNPAFDQAEAVLCALEQGAQAALFASGMAAATAVFQALAPGDHVLAPKVMYWSLRNWLMNFATHWGLDVELIDMTDPAAVEAFKAKHYLSDEDLTALQAITLPAERKVQDYRSTYNDVRDWLRREKAGAEKEKTTIDWDDVVFEVDLLKSQEINLDYILELIFEHNKKTKSKSELVDEVRRVIRASLGNRAKESLVVDFINQTDLDQIGDKASVIEVFFTFAQAEQQREAAELISDEGLNAEAAKRYITNSLKREFATENGTELNAVLPKMSPLNPQFLTKKQTVFQKIAAFVEKFKGVGGQL